MATISNSDLAPDEQVHYSVAGAEFDLDPGGTFETDDEQVLANAQAHPWLKVERPVVEPGDDGGPVVEVRYPATAIDAGLDQKVEQFEGAEDQVAETLAADDAQGDEPIVVDDPLDEPEPEPAPEG
jgi:hypothetical protein